MSGCHPVHEDEEFQNVSPLMKMIQQLEENYRGMFHDTSLLENMIKEHWDLNYKAQENLSKRITQVDNAVSQAVDELSSELAHLEARFKEKIKDLESSDHDERIHDLENIGAENRLIKLEKKFDKIDEDIISEMANCLDFVISLEKRVQHLEKHKYVNQVQYFGSQTPHKCPICEGSTFCKEGMDCKVCEGKGIVWG